MRHLSSKLHVTLFILSHVHCSVINISAHDEPKAHYENNLSNIDHIKTFAELQKDQIVSYILQNSAINQDFSKPSTEFMINVFKNLQLGEKLATATGHTGKRTPVRIRSADTIRSYSSKREGNVFKIDIPALPLHEKVRIAELRYHNNGNSHRRIKISVGVHYGEHSNIHSQNFNFSTSLSNSGGIYMRDISRRLSSNSSEFNGNITLEIVHKYSEKELRKDNSDNKMMLVLYNNDKAFMKDFYERLAKSDHNQKVMRYKRDLSKKVLEKNERQRKRNKWKKKKTRKGKCQLYDFKVDFDLIGWGPWIIHPKTFNSKVCYGKCPEPIGNEFSPTNHAMLQTLMRMKRPLSAPEPCCVPTKLRPLSMLYFEYNDIVVRHHEDMVAASCGCR